MGTNVFYLGDQLRVPSYRRTRARPTGAVTQGPWVAMARRRAALPLAPAGDACNDAPTRPAPAVRVSRSGSGLAADGAGRLRISGRLVDVCAELERLAAAETALGGTHPLCA